MIAYEQKVPNDWLNWHIHVYWSSFYLIKISFDMGDIDFIYRSDSLCPFMFPVSIFNLFKWNITNTYWLANITRMYKSIRTIWFRPKVHHGIYEEVHGYCTCLCMQWLWCRKSCKKKKKTKVASSISWHLIALYSK